MNSLNVRRLSAAYLALCATLTVLLVVEFGFLDDPRDPYAALMIVAIATVVLVPVYGLATGRAFGPRWVWWGLLVLGYVALVLGLVGLAGFISRGESASLLDRTIGLVGLLVNAAYLVALHAYLRGLSTSIQVRDAAET
ncbi:MAG TPA: hypothetical protein VFE82_03565 [Ramlibacter sp.]|jgi:hypothetical protein|uniref:hypothetical protein n=1 Tax=Ramlibacter sp. TaxID=1917967 RepID=UPI002D367BE8|nr:hypothetical protein [Ramlibacter sp.]HZY17530.1 hypothetical protein [Ramlibacter sp.]